MPERQPNQTSPITTALVMIPCAAAIVATIIAKTATDFGPAPTMESSAALVGTCLVAAAMLMSGMFGLGGSPLAGILFSFTAAGLVADGRLQPWDAMAALLALLGCALTSSDDRKWGGTLLLGLACGCSPLTAGALLTIAFIQSPPGKRLSITIPVIAIGCATAFAIETFNEQILTSALTARPEAARLGIHDVWRLVAHWTDLVLSVLVLALLAACAWFYDDSDGTMLNRVERGPVAWFAVNVLTAVVFPRLVVDHGLLFVLPCFLLVPTGWRMLQTLPLDRSHWTMSLFTISSRALPLALLWYPARKICEVALVAIFPP